MRDISGTVYRGFPAAKITRTDGGEVKCRGAVTRLSGDGGSFPGCEAHETGMLPSPKLAFTGWMEELACPGDVLEQDGSRWRVLECERLSTGGTAVCARALLERIEEAEDEGA